MGADAAALTVNVVELNPYAPRPFVFTEAARALRDSIEAAGYASRHSVNEADLHALNIVLGAVSKMREILREFDPAKTVVFNFEQLESNSILLDDEYLDWLRGWHVADYHSRNVAFLKQRNGHDQRVFELPLVPSPPAGIVEEAQARTVDVLFYGTLNERRSELIGRLEAAGLSVEVVAGAYAEELAPAMQRARLVLHAHFYDTGLFPVVRFLQPIAAGVPIVCENSVLSQLSDWSQSGIVFAEYESIVPACLRLLGSPAEQADRVAQSRRYAAQLDFVKPFEVMLAALLRDLGARAERASNSDGDGALSDGEIEAILAAEATQLPPEAHQPVAPIALAERSIGPSQGGMGRWATWVLLAFGLLMLWQTLR
jgi:hypothetical protein